MPVDQTALRLMDKAARVLNKSRAGARKRGIRFELPVEWVIEKLQGGVCERTGQPLDLTSTTSPDRPSVDRIDSSGAYTPANCQMTTYHYNIAKNRYSDKELLQLARRIVASGQS